MLKFLREDLKSYIHLESTHLKLHTNVKTNCTPVIKLGLTICTPLVIWELSGMVTQKLTSEKDNSNTYLVSIPGNLIFIYLTEADSG